MADDVLLPYATARARRQERAFADLLEWLAGPRDRPLLVHAKVTKARPAWWLEEAFRGN